jgi:hypothetical protein
MHNFADLADRSIIFVLGALHDAHTRLTDPSHPAYVERPASRAFVQTLQMIRLQKAILAVGMFSMFEAILQDGLGCAEGFREAGKILEDNDQHDLKERFDNLQLAINVLKHGKGRSYEALLEKHDLSFKVKQPTEAFFFEGDVSEVSTLVHVDDEFVVDCAQVIRRVAAAIRTSRPNFVG